MKIQQEEISASGIKFFIKKNDQEIGRAFLYILKNGLHQKPFGFLEDLFVAEKQRGKGIGTHLIKAVINAAKKNHCYKLIATSRYERSAVHQLYKKLKFDDHGKEFRINLE